MRIIKKTEDAIGNNYIPHCRQIKSYSIYIINIVEMAVSASYNISLGTLLFKKETRYGTKYGKI